MILFFLGRVTDITVHHKDGSGSLKQVIPPTRCPWGGNSVDDQFYYFLEKCFSSKVIDIFQKTEPRCFLDLFREFETSKRAFRLDQTQSVTVRIPVSLLQLVSKHTDKLAALEQSPRGDSSIYIRGDKLCIKGNTFKDLFKPAIEELVKQFQAMLRHEKLKDLEIIVMIGGFSGCNLVQSEIKERFGRDLEIYIPDETEIAVVKGAVIYGHSQNFQ